MDVRLDAAHSLTQIRYFACHVSKSPLQIIGLCSRKHYDLCWRSNVHPACAERNARLTPLPQPDLRREWVTPGPIALAFSVRQILQYHGVDFLRFRLLILVSFWKYPFQQYPYYFPCYPRTHYSNSHTTGCTWPRDVIKRKRPRVGMALPGRNQTVQRPFEKLLKNNDLGIIENPLRYIDEDDLEKYVRNFHEEEGLKDVVKVNVLIRGSKLVRDEEGFQVEGDLSEPEKKALKNEKVSKIWQESKELNIIILTCFVASIANGWTQGAIVGANQLWTDEFELKTGLTRASRYDRNTRDLWQFSATNAILYFSASTLGAFLCDPLTEIVTGRRGALFVAAAFTFAASIGAAYVQSWQALFSTRVLLGIGMGAKISVVPVYESEVSPARLRGTMDFHSKFV